MRCYIILIFTLLCSFTSLAQRPWTELSASEQRAVLDSRRVPDIVRSVMQGDVDIATLSQATRRELLDCIVARCGDENTSALYVYLYDIIRLSDGSMSRQDVRMFALHMPHMLAMLSADSQDDRFVNYAYSLGKRRVTHSKVSLKGVLGKMSKKRYLQYAGLVQNLQSAVDMVVASEDAGRSAMLDVTPPAQAEERFLVISKEEYESVTPKFSPAVEPLQPALTTLESAVRGECMAWSGAYHSVVHHAVGRNVVLVRSTTPATEYLTFVDGGDNSYTVENEVYMLSHGLFVAVEHSLKPQSLILGNVGSRTGVEILGRVYIDLGRELRGIKCAEEAIYLHVESSRGEEYLLLQLR